MAGLTNIQVDVPQKLILDQEYAVTIELSDHEGNPLLGKTPSVVFAPTKSVEDVELYDCSEPEEYDNCRPNNRGVEGVFESVFVLVDSPVTMTVSVGTDSKQVMIKADEVVAGENVVSEEVGQEEQDFIAMTTVPSAPVQVGPTPSVSYVLLPLALMLVIVTYFVVSTTD